MSDTNWYVRIRGRVQGPFSTDQVLAMRQQGRLSRIHELSTDGVSWQIASSYDIVFPTEIVKSEPRESEDAPVVGAESSDSTTTPQQSELWYYARSGEKFGPISLEELSRMAKSGVISGNDQVWQEGMEKWALASTIPSIGIKSPVGKQQKTTPGTPPKTNGLAITCLICGILGFCTIFTGVIAIVLAHVSLHNIHRSRGTLDGKGLAIAGLLLGWLSLFMWLGIAILQFKILPSLQP